MALRAMNGISDPEGLVPTLLVFEIFPRIVGKLHELPEYKERFRFKETARMECQGIFREQ